MSLLTILRSGENVLVTFVHETRVLGHLFPLFNLTFGTRSSWILTRLVNVITVPKYHCFFLCFVVVNVTLVPNMVIISNVFNILIDLY